MTDQSGRSDLSEAFEIRFEQPGDEAGIDSVHEKAFGRPDEARLVDRLRSNGNLFLSLVALQDSRIVGHISFVPLRIDSRDAGTSFEALGLAPLGVLPEYQGRGIGAALIRAGLEECARRGHRLVIVLGDPVYYGAFGFVPAKPFGIGHAFPFEIPEEAFMLRYAGEALPTEIRGVVRYTPEFNGID